MFVAMISKLEAVIIQCGINTPLGGFYCVVLIGWLLCRGEGIFWSIEEAGKRQRPIDDPHVWILISWRRVSSGGRVDETPPGTRVRVSGLNHDVMEDDIKELFSGVGDLLHCEVGFCWPNFCSSPSKVNGLVAGVVGVSVDVKLHADRPCVDMPSRITSG